MHEEDAAIAVGHGADGIVVSNHGGRQLDGTLSPLKVLPSIADHVGTETVVMLDGGIRRGTDIIKALALGAKFIFVGRPFLYAAAVGGQPGVLMAADILKTELHRNMALLGVNSIEEITSDLIAEV